VKQQINLYQPIFRKQRIVFSAQTMLMLSIGLLLLLLLWSLLISQRVSQLEAEHERQLAAEERAIEQLTELRQTLPPSEPSPALQATVDELEQRRTQLRQSLVALDRQLPAAQVHLRERVEAIGRQVPHGLWITGLELTDNGRHLALHGRALSPRLVPAYLDKLSGEPLMSGLGFRQVRVQTADDDTPGVEFFLSTRREEQP
jgi:hypothetical protein